MSYNYTPSVYSVGIHSRSSTNKNKNKEKLIVNYMLNKENNIYGSNT